MSLMSRSSSWSFTVALVLGCGASTDGLYGSDAATDDVDGDALNSEPPILFPGAGTSGAAQPLVPGLSPDSSSDCDPEPSAAAPTATVQSSCFYTEDEPLVPAAIIEQVVEVVGNAEWVHVRLILNPTFADNSYGTTAIGWAKADTAVEEPAAPVADRPERERPPRRDRGAHSFRDLVGSDHAEIQLLDGAGAVTLHFKLDYLSESADAPSGYASLGVSGGEGKLIEGDAAAILATSTSMDRNLNACGLSSFVEDSPSTNDDYAPNGAAPNWDYRVIYEVWVATEAFGSAGFGSALIESVHASPSKSGENTETVAPGPCPPAVDPPAPEAPEPRISEIR